MHWLSYELHVNFNTFGFALLTLSLLFPIFDRLTERTIAAYNKLKKSISKSPTINEKIEDELHTRIEDKKVALLEKSALSEFKYIIGMSIGFILMSAINNCCGKVFFLIPTCIYLIVLSIMIYKTISSLLTEGNKIKGVTQECMDFIDNPMDTIRKKI
jgi:hypothetical protein